jgi:DinB family protein
VHVAWKSIVRQQFGAAIDMLDNAIVACPDEVWGDRTAQPEFWYVAYHTVFFLDLYLSDSTLDFTPPKPFTLDELDPRGVMPARAYAKAEVRGYLAHCREKCRLRIDSLTDDQTNRYCDYGWMKVSVGEALLYNMRHVQHHAGQLNLLLRQRINMVPKWVARTSASSTA